MDSSQEDHSSRSPTSVPPVSSRENGEIQESTDISMAQLNLPMAPTSLTTDLVPSGPQSETTPETPRDPRQPASTSIESVEDTEHAYWAEIEEDRSGPDEEEMKEINASEQDYSACDRTLRSPQPPRKVLRAERLTVYYRCLLGEQLLPGLR